MPKGFTEDKCEKSREETLGRFGPKLIAEIENNLGFAEDTKKLVYYALSESYNNLTIVTRWQKGQSSLFKPENWEILGSAYSYHKERAEKPNLALYFLRLENQDQN